MTDHISGGYAKEPPTYGKILLHTTVGDLDIELWPKQAPKAVRNFVQLCMEGYYDGCEFHRVIPKFMVQTGDPTNTGRGGESIYDGKPFKDEFHARLTFSHRGIVACANEENTPHTNQSQFFITLDRCDWLNRKHTIFGKVTGNTIFNLLKFNDLELKSTNDGDIHDNSRPVHPPIILSCEILLNPFDDIIPRTLPKHQLLQIQMKQEKLKEEKERREVAVKDTNLLSFGGEEEENNSNISMVRKKKRGDNRWGEKKLEEYESNMIQQQELFGRSQQPVSVEQIRAKLIEQSSRTNSNEINPTTNHNIVSIDHNNDHSTKKEKEKKEKKEEGEREGEGEEEKDIGQDIRLRLINEHNRKRKRNEIEKKSTDNIEKNRRRRRRDGNEDNSNEEAEEEEEEDDMSPEKKRIKLDSEYEQLKQQLLQKHTSTIANKKSEEDHNSESDTEKNESKPKINPLEAMRNRYLHKHITKKNREEYTMSKLNDFVQKLSEQPNTENKKQLTDVENTSHNNHQESSSSIPSTKELKIDTNTGIKFKDKLYGEDIDDDDIFGKDWMYKPLIFTKRPQDYNLFNAEEYITLDPTRKEDQQRLKEKEGKIQQLFDFRQSLEESSNRNTKKHSSYRDDDDKKGTYYNKKERDRDRDQDRDKDKNRDRDRDRDRDRYRDRNRDRNRDKDQD